MVAVFATGFTVGRFSGEGNMIVTSSRNVPVESSSQNDSITEGDQSTGIEENTTISTDNLTDGQKKMLSAVGIDAESIVVTPEMAACADTSVGASRMSEIINGATPSITEGIKLVACYK